MTSSLKRFRNSPVHLFFLILCFFWVYPFMWMVSGAFKTQSEMFLNGLSLIPRELTFENFARAWGAANFDTYTLNTIIITLSVVFLVLLISSLAGYALGRGNMPGKRIILGVLIATMFLPSGYTIIPLYELISWLGLNNTLAGVILAEVGPAQAIAILLFMGYFASIPRELEESAIIDGASQPVIFLRIMLPLARPIIGTVAIFNFVSTWNAFFLPLIFTLTAPQLRPLGVGMYAFYGEFSVDWTGLAAGACISVIPVIVVFLFLQRYFVEGLSGAIKG